MVGSAAVWVRLLGLWPTMAIPVQAVIGGWWWRSRQGPGQMRGEIWRLYPEVNNAGNSKLPAPLAYAHPRRTAAGTTRLCATTAGHGFAIAMQRPPIEPTPRPDGEPCPGFRLRKP